MNENQDEGIEEQPNKSLDQEDDDLKLYLSEMAHLESDFSDLEDLDMDELQEMQDAIEQVKESVDSDSEEISLDDDLSHIEAELKEELDQKTTLFEDFSDMGELDFDELKDMKEAIEGVKLDESSLEEGEFQSPQDIPNDLEARIKAELEKKQEKEEETIITPEKFLEYVKEKRDKIWYHSLWYLVFEVDDHVASKVLLYDVLKEVTSKNAIDPIPEHQFYFGLGYILRLNMNEKQIIRYMSGGKFKINVNVENLKSLLEEAGEPISLRPVIEEGEKKKMYSNFLKDDFLDI